MWDKIKKGVTRLAKDELLPDLVEFQLLRFVAWLRVWASRP